jgi:hypothetical protein
VRPVGSIVSPWVDTVCVGGGSLALLLFFFLKGDRALLSADIGTYDWLEPVKLWLATLVNMPHFLASYRMVYRSRATILKHRWAAIYVPVILLVYNGFAIWLAQYDVKWIILLYILSGCYLAWHYTGQAWGMMATYAHLGGAAFDRLETRLIRSGLRLLLAWHVVWFLFVEFNVNLGGISMRSMLAPVLKLLTMGMGIAFVLGLAGFARYHSRLGRLPPARSLIAWAAIFMWYLALYRDPRAIFWVQIAHALQYLIFPFRVEANRTAASGASPGKVRLHLQALGVALVIIGFLFMEFFPAGASELVKGVLGTQAGLAAMMAPTIFLNIHHYFTDGAIWKLRNPEVRADLFAHLQTPARGA